MTTKRRRKLHNLVDRIPEARLKDALRLVGELLPSRPCGEGASDEWLRALQQLDAEQTRDVSPSVRS